MHSRLSKIMQPMVLILSAALLVLTALLQVEQIALISIVIVVFAMTPFFLRFEYSKPKPRDIVPIVVLSVIAALGRTIFAFVPNFQPVTAVVILTGIVFGSQAGFLSGALSALVSNMFLGQGPWTPWQMLAWGLAGFLAGAMQKTWVFKKNISVYIYGFMISWFFGWLMNVWHVIGFVHPVTWKAIIGVYAASSYFDFSHALSTVICLVLILNPWRKKLCRIKRKHGIVSGDEGNGIRIE